MTDTLHIKITQPVPADEFDRADHISAAKTLKAVIADAVKEHMPDATVSLGIEAPPVVKAARKPRAAKTTTPTLEVIPDASAESIPDAAPHVVGSRRKAA